MAIYLPRTDAIILEIARTGSKWVRAAIAAAGVPHEHIGPAEWRGHGDLEVHGRQFRFICAFVRNPIAWYASYWARRRERGWRQRFELDRRCSSSSFRAFVRTAATELPGYLTAMYERYVGRADDPIDFVGRQEYLVDDFIHALRRAGETFDERVVRDLPRVNVSTHTPAVTDDLQELIILSEYPVCRRFGYAAAEEQPVIAELRTAAADDVDALRSLALWTASMHWTPDDAREVAGTATTAATRSARALSNYALYAEYVHGDVVASKRLYERAVALAPTHPRTLALCAIFLYRHDRDYDAAEALFQRAVAARPDHAESLGAYAVFLSVIRRDYARAEAMYRAALQSNPRHPQNLANFGAFMHAVRGDANEAERLYAAAVAADPEDADTVAKFASFQAAVAKENDGVSAAAREPHATCARAPDPD